MNVKKAIAYEIECPSCLSLIRFEPRDVRMGGYDDHGTITCPVCCYQIKVKDRSSINGHENVAFRNSVRPIYEKNEELK